MEDGCWDKRKQGSPRYLCRVEISSGISLAESGFLQYRKAPPCSHGYRLLASFCPLISLSDGDYNCLHERDASVNAPRIIRP